MRRSYWKTVQPRDWQHAQELCLEYAKEKHNRSVDTVASLMGELNKWTLYKWIEAGNLPLRLVKSFEHACGADYVSRWLATCDNKLLIDIPRGRKGTSEDIHALQSVLNDMVGALIKFYDNKADSVITVAAVQTALESAAWHKGNVEKYRQPELPFDEENNG